MTKPKQKSLFKKTVIALLFVTITLTAYTFVDTCQTKIQKIESQEVSPLVSIFPALERFDVTSCRYVITATRHANILPSPHNHERELLGTAHLSPAGFKAIQSEYDWQPVKYDSIPDRLRAIVPEGHYFTSQTLNNSPRKSENDLYYWRWVIFNEDSQDCVIHILLADREHRIDNWPETEGQEEAIKMLRGER